MFTVTGATLHVDKNANNVIVDLNYGTFIEDADANNAVIDYETTVSQAIVSNKIATTGNFENINIVDFTLNDRIDLQGVRSIIGVVYNPITDTLNYTADGKSVSVSLTLAAGAPNNFNVGTLDDGSNIVYIVDGPPCFVTGTRILTARGEVPVEALRVGDQAMAVLGGTLRPIRWIGHRRLDLSAHPKPDAVYPIRVSAGAFADGTPHRDLWLSPGHFVFVDGVLIQIGKLVNGATIVQVPRHEVVYWHVELDGHEVLLAEGLQVESYLDTGNRNAFANAEGFVELHPAFMPKHWTETCAPLVMSGPQITAVQARLLQRADELGYAITYDCDLHLVVDGQVVSACEAEIGQYRFRLPPGAADVRLTSRASVPAHVHPGNHDTRPLGVRVSRIQLDDAGDLPLDRLDLDEGWHGLESDDLATWRWTAGAARLPAGARTISIELIGDGTYRYLGPTRPGSSGAVPRDREPVPADRSPERLRELGASRGLT